jgi:hypothetical protein
MPVTGAASCRDCVVSDTLSSQHVRQMLADLSSPRSNFDYSGKLRFGGRNGVEPQFFRIIGLDIELSFQKNCGSTPFLPISVRV